MLMGMRIERGNDSQATINGLKSLKKKDHVASKTYQVDNAFSPVNLKLLQGKHKNEE